MIAINKQKFNGIFVIVLFLIFSQNVLGGTGGNDSNYQINRGYQQGIGQSMVHANAHPNIPQHTGYQPNYSTSGLQNATSHYPVDHLTNFSLFSNQPFQNNPLFGQHINVPFPINNPLNSHRKGTGAFIPSIPNIAYNQRRGNTKSPNNSGNSIHTTRPSNHRVQTQHSFPATKANNAEINLPEVDEIFYKYEKI